MQYSLTNKKSLVGFKTTFNMNIGNSKQVYGESMVAYENLG